MRILLANKFFFMNGGSERVFFQERDYLKSQGVDVIDFSMRDERNFDSPYKEYFVDNVDYRGSLDYVEKLKAAASFVHSGRAVGSIASLIAAKKPDIAHLHNIYHQLTPSIVRECKKQGVRVIMTLHDYKIICPSYLALNKGKVCTACDGSMFWKPLTRHCQQSWLQEMLLAVEAYWHKWARSYEKVDLFLTPSRFLADLAGRRLVREKISVLRNGIDIDAHRPISEDGQYYLYFGRLSPEKGVETLLDAHKRTGGKFNLKVVGTGSLEQELVRHYQQIDFLGYKTGDELKRLVSNASFVVVPSEGYENCPMAVLEAMAFGKPVIGSRIGGIPEQIEDGVTGFLFEPGSADELAARISRLWGAPDLRRNMGEAARRKLEREFSLEEHCKRLLAIYEDVLGGRKNNA